MAQPDAWSETALVAVAAQAGSDMTFHTITETVDIDIGEKGFDIISTLGGGRLVKFTPQEPTTVTLEAYPVDAGTASGTTGKGFFGMLNTEGTEPLDLDSDRKRNKYRIALLWTDSTSITTANEEVGTGTYCMRFVAADGYFISVKPSYTDKLLKFTIVYKVPPFDKDGTANIVIQSTDASATLTALASYTSSVKW